MAVTKHATVGIEVKGIEKIKSAIDSYISDVKSKLDISTTQAKIDAALKGSESVESLKQMATAIEQAMESNLTHLEQYKKYLDTLQAAYENNDKGNATFTNVASQYSNNN